MCNVKPVAHCESCEGARLAPMARSPERLGKPTLPKWWTEIVFPLLENPDVDYGVLAEKASIFASRTSPWKRDAISKFKSGAARTRELANGISMALGVPQPYFEARSPKESEAISALMLAVGGTPTTPDQDAKIALLNDVGDKERAAASDQTRRVPSRDEGTSRRGRTRRSTRGRA